MRYLSLLSIVFFLASCSGEEDSNSDQNENSNVENGSETDSLVTGWGEEPDTNEVEVFIEDIPSEWIMLSDEDGDGEDLVIYAYCEAETQNFSLTPSKGEAWEIYLGYGQDGEVCEITFFEAFETEEEGMHVVTGTFRYKATYDESVRFVDFSWNEDKMLGHFEGLGMGSEWFCPADSQDEFATIEEDCEGLWE